MVKLLFLCLAVACGTSESGGATGSRAAGARPPSPPAAAKGDATSLYQRLGGLPAIEAVVNDFVRRTTSDPRIKERFFNTDAAHLKKMLAEQVCAATGGPCTYSGRDMGAAHGGMEIVEEWPEVGMIAMESPYDPEPSIRVEDASVSLGVPPFRTFWRVTVPLMFPAIVSGATLAWITTIGELSSSILLYSGPWATTSVAIFTQVFSNHFGTASALASILIVAAAGPLFLMYRFLGRQAAVAP